MPPIDFRLYLIGDRNQTCGRPLAEVIREAIQGGVSAVQFREKDLSLLSQLQLAQEVQAVTKANRVKLFINDRVDLCLALDAEGVHLPAFGLPIHVARKLLGDTRWIAVSCHSIEEVQRAESEGADFAVLGPIYETPSKRSYGPPLGIDYFQKAKRSTSLPLFAIGGVHKERLRELFAAGADGVALISEIMAAGSPQKTSQEISDEMRRLSSGSFCPP